MRARPSWDEYFLKLARCVADRSPDEETQVGCVVVGGDHRVLSTGYNGFPPGFPDTVLPTTRPEKYVYMVHAEANAIGSAGRYLRGATLYCTHSPCVDCAKLLITAGIVRVVCAHMYQNTDNSAVLELFRYGNVRLVVPDG